MIEIHFDYEKSTKGTHRYKENAGTGPVQVGTLYIKKIALPEPAPVVIVTITPHPNNR